jgi:hypothetical protein
LRLISLFVLLVGVWLSGPAVAQIPIPPQEQVAVFNSLSPTQQQALIRELQSQLPPAQREAVINMLMGQSGSGNRQATEGEPGDVDIGAFATEIVDSSEAEIDDEERLSAGSTLVIEFESRLPQPGAVALTPTETLERGDFLERLQDANPYTLDSAGRLQLPGVRAIALAGLNVEQATTLLRTERALSPFVMFLTLLPLEPVGTAALEPFGYDMFSGSSNFRPSTRTFLLRSPPIPTTESSACTPTRSVLRLDFRAPSTSVPL